MHELTRPVAARPLLSAMACVCLIFATGHAFAEGVDSVYMDPSIGSQTITFTSASNATATVLPVVFTA